MKGLDGAFIDSCWKNIVREIRGDTMEEPRLEGMAACFTFLKPEGEGATLLDGLFGWRVLTR